MLSFIWTGMILFSILAGVFLGNSHLLSAAAMEGASTAVTLTLSLAGPLCLWCGVGELMRRSGLRDRLGRLLRPVLTGLFPRLRKQPEGFSALSANVTANLLGLGNAATPMGIEACRAMGDDSGTATDDQCRLVILNTASIQLIPTTIVALRAGLGCKTPLDILPAVLLTSLVSVSAGLLVGKVLSRLYRHAD